MSELPLDFDNVLAYAIPGLVVIIGAAWLKPTWKHWFTALHSDHAASALVGMAIFTLVIGMLLGCVRSAVLNPLCKLDLRWAYGSDGFGPISGDWEPINYGKLVDEGHLGALREAKVNERTPYQFFGNTLMAILILVIIRIVLLCRCAIRHQISRSKLIAGILAATLVLAIAVLILYPSYRTKHYRYKHALEAINAA